MTSPVKTHDQRASQNEEDDVSTLGSHGHAQANFDSTLASDVADQSVDADDGQQQCKSGEGSQHVDDQAAAGERAGDEILKRLDISSGLGAVRGCDSALYRGSQSVGIAVGTD